MNKNYQNKPCEMLEDMGDGALCGNYAEIIVLWLNEIRVQYDF